MRRQSKLAGFGGFGGYQFFQRRYRDLDPLHCQPHVRSSKNNAHEPAQSIHQATTHLHAEVHKPHPKVNAIHFHAEDHTHEPAHSNFNHQKLRNFQFGLIEDQEETETKVSFCALIFLFGVTVGPA